MKKYRNIEKSACNVLDDANGFDEITDRPFCVS